MFVIRSVLPITDIFPTLMMDNNNPTNHTTQSAILDTAADRDYLFMTLHGNPVTVAGLLIVIVVVVLAVWIILLNCLLLEVLIRRHMHLETTDIFIYSLAIIDTIIGFLLLYNSVYNVVNYQNEYECFVRFGLIQSMLLNSTGHIGLLTVNRYIKIVYPFHYYKIFRKKPIVITSGCIWFFSLLFGFLPIMGWNKEFNPAHPDDKHLVCRYFGIMDPHYIMVNVSLYWVPLILMIVMYSHVSRIAWRHVREIRAHEQAVSQGKDNGAFETRSWRFTKTVLIIVGVYFFCWLPSGVFLVLQVSGSLHNLSLTEQGDILTYTSSAGFLNSLLNPIIYATKIPAVKSRFKQMFCCKNDGTDSRRNSSPTFSVGTDSRRNSSPAFSIVNTAFTQIPD